jgi:predicted DNA-binding transcriptional regulator YafY
VSECGRIRDVDGPDLETRSRDPHLTLRRVERQQRLIEVLASAPRRWPASELAAGLGVSRRTVERDLARLREAGVPLDTAAGRYGGARVRWETGERVVRLTVPEIVALLTSLTALGPTATDSARSARDSLVRALQA